MIAAATAAAITDPMTTARWRGDTGKSAPTESRRAGKVVSKSTLTEHLYAEDMERDSNVIEVFVRRLRTKLDPAESLHPIETLRGQGYRWTLPRSPQQP